MSRRLWIGISLGLNLALAGVVVHAAKDRAPERRSSFAAADLTNRVVRVERVIDADHPAVFAVDAPFHWAQVESADYRVYVANLRAIGCPEATLRDIIEADVNELFAGRVEAMVDAVTGRFWELMLKKSELEQLVKDKEHELRSLEEERDTMLQTLFEENDADPKVKQAKQAEERAEAFANLKNQLDFLADDKIALIQEAQERQRAAWKDFESAQPGASPVDKQRKRQELEAEKERSIQAQLTPQEFAEYKLRTGNAAGTRFGLWALDVTEAEVRAIAEAKTGPQSEGRIKQLLGPERYAEYQRAGDNNYQQARRITDRFELPPETAVRIYEVQKAIQEQAQSIRRDQGRSIEERQAILQALQAEAENSIAAELGPEAFKTYRKYGGGWLSGFAANVK